MKLCYYDNGGVCALGAIGYRESNCDDSTDLVRMTAADYLRRALPTADDKRYDDKRYYANVISYNDAASTTQADVLALFDRAIARRRSMLEVATGA
jgi:hypothetical protein